MGESTLLSRIALVTSGANVARGGEEARAVMVGDLDGSGVLPGRLASVGSPKGGEAARLRPDDIVVSLRGTSNFAAVATAADGADLPLFATLDLAVVRLLDQFEVDPHYVAAVLNLPHSQQALSVHRSGTGALRLPLGALRDLPIRIMPREHQQAIVELARAANEERRLVERMGDLRRQYINELLRRATTEGPAPDSIRTQAATGPGGPSTTVRALSTRSRKDC